eukprot:TRINITY_DN462_c0_g1_i1.p1 TRINITY_DN462_c0_g1~~TRINITY_DN462_c0_g1_i1.p1  ORF type:complete len:263 (+),score=54.57 TRINITY_DN462_c0_g1_i1:53-841(+)
MSSQDIELSFQDLPTNQRERREERSPFLDSGLQSKLASQVVESVFETTKDRVSRAYASIDILRPYFDVDVSLVLRRLVQSLIPRPRSRVTEDPQTEPVADPEQVLERPDLYGPLMLVLTLVSLLHYSMKLSHVNLVEGTLLSASLITCFSYWIGGSLMFASLGYLFDNRLSFVQILALTGYGLFSYCIGIGVACVFPPRVFYMVWICVAIPSALKMGFVYMAMAPQRKGGLATGVFVATVHVFFLLYLKTSYASLYQVVASV